MLNLDFKEFIKSLNDHKVRYLIVGGYAVAIHGHPRYTKDIDVWIEPSQENAVRLIAALDAFGFGALGLRTDDFLDPSQVVQLGYPPNRIDLLLALKGVDFENCYTARLQVEIDGMTVDFIDLENLKKNKQAVGRFQDLADLENLR
jgi:predicted nucleotidyltransferase